MAYTVSNKCAKNLCKRTVLLKLIIKNVFTCFFGTQCRFSVNSCCCLVVRHPASSQLSLMSFTLTLLSGGKASSIKPVKFDVLHTNFIMLCYYCVIRAFIMCAHSVMILNQRHWQSLSGQHGKGVDGLF